MAKLMGLSRVFSLSKWKVFGLVLFSVTIGTLLTFGLKKSGRPYPKSLTSEVEVKNQQIESSPLIILQPIGGIGNQLFQFACSYAFSRDLGVKLVLVYPHYLVTQSKRRFGPNDREYALDYFNIPHTIETSLPTSMLSHHVSPGQRSFNEHDIWAWNKNNLKTSQTGGSSSSLSTPLIDHDLRLNGYCESYTLFQNHKSEVMDQLEMMTQKIGLSSEVKTLLDLIQGSESIAVHFRLGDFKRSFDFRVLPFKYQMNAMTLALKNLMLRETNKLSRSGSEGRSIKFFIFSSEIEETRREFLRNGYLDQFSAQGASIFFVSNPRLRSIQEFFLMVACRHFIISNSTFSWWASYISKYFRTKNRTTNDTTTMIIAPKPRHYPAWYRQYHNYGANNFTDSYLYYPSDWITIDPFS